MAKTIKTLKNNALTGVSLNKNPYFHKHPVLFYFLVICGIYFIIQIIYSIFTEDFCNLPVKQFNAFTGMSNCDMNKIMIVVYKGLAIIGLLVLVLGFRKVICPSCGIKDAVVWNQVKKCPKCGRELKNYGFFSRIWGLDK